VPLQVALQQALLCIMGFVVYCWAYAANL